MDKTQLGAFVAENRKALGLTQRELADRLHVTDKAVSKWERGLSYPDVTLLEPLADVFHLSLTELVSCARHEESADGTAREEQPMKDLMEISTDNTAAERKKKRRWIAALGAVCLILAAVLLLLSKRFPLAGVLALKGGVRIESAAVLQVGTAEDGLPDLAVLNDEDILRLEICLRDGSAYWRGFSKKSLVWNAGTLYTLRLNYNNGQSQTCRVLNGMLYAGSYAYRLDPETAAMLDHSLTSFVLSSRWAIPAGSSWDQTALVYWRDGAYDVAGPLYTRDKDTAVLREMVTSRTFEDDRDFTMRVLLSSDWFAGGTGKIIVDGIEYTFFADTGTLYCNSRSLLAAEPLTEEELAAIRDMIERGQPHIVEGGANTVTYFQSPAHYMRHGFRINVPEGGVSLLLREYDDGQPVHSEVRRYDQGQLEELFFGLIPSDEKNLELSVTYSGAQGTAEERWPLLQYIELPGRRGYQLGAAKPLSDLEPVPLREGEAVALYCACVSNTYNPEVPAPETLTEETIAQYRGHLAVVWLFIGEPPAWVGDSEN